MFQSLKSVLALASLTSAAAFYESAIFERQSVGCATGLHLMIASGCGIPCSADVPSLLETLISNISYAFPGTDQYFVPYNDNMTQAQNSTPVMIEAFNSYVTECPQTPIVFIGYSLGAVINMNVLCGGVSSSYTPNVVASIIYGDETYESGLAYDLGTCTQPAPKYARVNSAAACAAYAPAIQSYCDFDDPNCCTGGTNQSTHFTYPEIYDVKALKFILSRYAALAAATSTTSSSTAVSTTVQSTSTSTSTGTVVVSTTVSTTATTATTATTSTTATTATTSTAADTSTTATTATTATTSTTATTAITSATAITSPTTTTSATASTSTTVVTSSTATAAGTGTTATTATTPATANTASTGDIVSTANTVSTASIALTSTTLSTATTVSTARTTTTILPPYSNKTTTGGASSSSTVSGTVVPATGTTTPGSGSTVVVSTIPHYSVPSAPSSIIPAVVSTFASIPNSAILLPSSVQASYLSAVGTVASSLTGAKSTAGAVTAAGVGSSSVTGAKSTAGAVTATGAGSSAQGTAAGASGNGAVAGSSATRSAAVAGSGSSTGTATKPSVTAYTGAASRQLVSGAMGLAVGFAAYVLA